MRKIKDLGGKRFGKLVAIEPTDMRKAKYMVWRCVCDCGNECFADSKRLLRGTITNCGCVPKANKQNGSIPADITGMVFGELTVLSRAEKEGNRSAWHCKCDCGNELTVTTHDLRTGKKKNCGCKLYVSRNYRDLMGQRFGYLTVVNQTEKRDYKGSILWECKCDCGKNVLYSEDNLVHGQIKSCGCYRDTEVCKKINEKLHRIEGTCIERLNLQKPRSDNRSGYVGVHKVNDNCYKAAIGFKGKKYHLGTFASLEEAIEARRKGEQIHLNFLNMYRQKYLKEVELVANE